MVGMARPLRREHGLASARGWPVVKEPEAKYVRSGHLRVDAPVATMWMMDSWNEQVLFETRYDIKHDIGVILRLLRGDDDGGEEATDS
jgi:hypothetical protein